MIVSRPEGLSLFSGRKNCFGNSPVVDGVNRGKWRQECLLATGAKKIERRPAWRCIFSSPEQGHYFFNALPPSL